jgi:hypothetical protein
MPDLPFLDVQPPPSPDPGPAEPCPAAGSVSSGKRNDPSHERIVLELEPLPSDRPLSIRLRLLLKDLLRRQQLRCVAITGVAAVDLPAVPPAVASSESAAGGEGNRAVRGKRLL